MLRGRRVDEGDLGRHVIRIERGEAPELREDRAVDPHGGDESISPVHDAVADRDHRPVARGCGEHLPERLRVALRSRADASDRSRLELLERRACTPHTSGWTSPR